MSATSHTSTFEQHSAATSWFQQQRNTSTSSPVFQLSSERNNHGQTAAEQQQTTVSSMFQLSFPLQLPPKPQVAAAVQQHQTYPQQESNQHHFTYSNNTSTSSNGNNSITSNVKNEILISTEQLKCFVMQEICNYLNEDYYSTDGLLNCNPYVRQLVSSLSELVSEGSNFGNTDELFSQFSICMFEMIKEPELLILQEQQIDRARLQIAFQAHLKLLRIRALLVFLIVRLDDGKSKSNPDTLLNLLVGKGDLMIDLDALSAVSVYSFISELRTIEQLIRFNVDITGCDITNASHIRVEYYLANNTMNHIVLQSNYEDKLVASFNNLEIHASGMRQQQESSNLRLRMRLYAHIGKYMTFAKCGQLLLPSPMNQLAQPEYPSSKIRINRFAQDNRILSLIWNSDFFLTPGRQKTDICFAVDLDDKTTTGVDSVYIDHLKIRSPSTGRVISVRRSGREMLDSSVQYVTSVPSINTTSESHATVLNSNSKRNYSELSKDMSHRKVPLVNILLPSPQQLMQLRVLQAQFSTNSFALSIEEITEQSSRYGYRKRQRTQDNNTSKVLLQSIKDVCGFTLLHIAAFYGFRFVCQYLMEHANFNADVVDNYLYTPYQWACFAGHSDTATYLLSSGASPTLRNIHLCRGVDIAESQKHSELINNIETELQRQACCTLFNLSTSNPQMEEDHLMIEQSIDLLVSADAQSRQDQMNNSNNNSSDNHSSSEDEKKPSKQTKQGQRKNGKSTTVSNTQSTGKGRAKSTTGAAKTRGTTKTAIQPATLIKKTPKGDGKEQLMDLFIKPSRKKRTYISFFPKELCSSPYKYDILLRIPLRFTNQFNEQQFTFQLLLQGNDQQWAPVKQAVEVVKYLRTMFPVDHREIEWRIMFKVCSFHFHRKPFKLQVMYNSNSQAALLDGSAASTTGTSPSSSSNPGSPLSDGGNNDEDNCDNSRQSNITLPDNSVVFESEPFWVVARKKKDWNEFSETNDS
jgi:hypothetical protein